MADTTFSLDDKYTQLEGRVALSGIHALVRLPMEQHRRDKRNGLRVGTYISGYQGSPLGELDKQIRLASHLLREHDVVWQPGINEDVAATAIYGSQLLHLFPHGDYDGVVGLWYGKGPGVDRTGDAFRHGQFLGTSPHGGAVALVGDDTSCKSSTIPSDTTVSLYDLFFPVIYPGDPAEVLDLGLHAIAMSRYCGLWTALKIVTDVADGGAVIDLYPERALPVLPELEIGGKPFRKQQDSRLLPPYTVEMERQIFYERLVAARAYARANKLDRVTVHSGSDRLGLVASGKTYPDLMQALEMLGFGEGELRQAGIRVYKLGMIAPLEPQGLAEFAEGLEEILVVEEKRGFIETQVRDALYNRANHPAVYGKFDEHGAPLFPMHGEMGADMVARLLAGYLAGRLGRPDLPERVRWLFDIAERSYEPVMPRTPYFCSGCPHNTSTTLPEAELAGGGIGCHAMAAYMNRGVTWLTHMGGEGAPWMGIAPFSEKTHLFQNVGDGTFSHSASKALEACIASGVNMTFKLLYNAAVAMTGGQTVVGARTPLELARQLEAQGAAEVVIVPELSERYPRKRISPKIRVEPKAEYNRVMLELRKVPGVTVIIFDQQCAAEKRRQRKRGLQAIPRKRVIINEAVCEGCGDCGVKSNCLSVVPVETGYGRKTQIHQSSCNMDYSCIKGDCPAFMTVVLAEGAGPARKQGLAVELRAEELPEPADKASCERPYKAMLIGIGGTGVVTVDAVLVTAALLDGKYAVHLDQTGLAQKGGAVLSNLILSEAPVHHANRIAAGEADLVLAFDLLATVSRDNLNRFHPERTVAVANTAQISTAEVVTNVHSRFPELERLEERLAHFTRRTHNRFLNAEAIAEALFGDHMPANLFLVGVAYQAGLLPLGAEAIEQAITINGVAVEQNIKAFRWGRKYLLDPDAVLSLLGNEPPAEPMTAAVDKLRRFAPGQVAAFEALAARFPKGEALAALLAPRVADLILYQDAAYARRYLDFVRHVAEAEHARTPGRTTLREAVARWLFKLMAYKDEYEVARLWLQDGAWAEAAAAFDGPVKRYVHLHPPLFRRLGLSRKLRLGAWFLPVLRLLYGLRRLRGGPLDVFGLSAHRRLERSLPGWYRGLIDELLPALNHENHGSAVAIAEAPDGIRGYEQIKERTLAETREAVARLQETFRSHGAAVASQAAGD